jgi:hypothetical protein
VVTYRPLQVVHCFRVPGQDCDHLDIFGSTYVDTKDEENVILTDRRRVEAHRTKGRRRRMARELEPERQRPGRQHRRQQGELVEGEVERRMGVCQDD